MPCRYALLALVALGSSSSTELGDVKTCLKAYSGVKMHFFDNQALKHYCNQKLIPKKAIPRVIGVVCKVSVEKEGPLIAANLHLPATKLLLCPEEPDIKIGSEFK